jgi:hypothetical protein
VRVARRLEELPRLADAFAAGRVSYSKVRAITRVAEPDDGIDWVEHARHSSAAQLEKLVRGVRRTQVNEQAAADPEAAEWSLRTRTRYNDNGSFSMTISGPAELLPVVQAGIDAKKAELQRQRDAAAAEAVAAVPVDVFAAAPEPKSEPEPVGVSAETDLDEQAAGWPDGTSRRDVQEATECFFAAVQGLRETTEEHVDQPAPRLPVPKVISQVAKDLSAETATAARVTDAEALLALAQDALAAEQAAHPDAARRRRPQLNAHIDPLSGWGRLTDGELLPPSSLRAVMKTLPGRAGAVHLRPVTAADLRRHDLGRTQREADTALRELLGTVDGECCRFPGCTRRKKLHAHHVRFWSDGGGTDLDNLVLVCSRHHTLIHAQGFSLVLDRDRRLEVHTAEGVAIVHHPAQPWGDPAALGNGCHQLVSAETLPPDHVDGRLDLRYAVSVLMAQAA